MDRIDLEQFAHLVTISTGMPEKVAILESIASTVVEESTVDQRDIMVILPELMPNAEENELEDAKVWLDSIEFTSVSSMVRDMIFTTKRNKEIESYTIDHGMLTLEYKKPKQLSMQLVSHTGNSLALFNLLQDGLEQPYMLRTIFEDAVNMALAHSAGHHYRHWWYAGCPDH